MHLLWTFLPFCKVEWMGGGDGFTVVSDKSLKALPGDGSRCYGPIAIMAEIKRLFRNRNGCC